MGQGWDEMDSKKVLGLVWLALFSVFIIQYSTAGRRRLPFPSPFFFYSRGGGIDSVTGRHGNLSQPSPSNSSVLSIPVGSEVPPENRTDAGMLGSEKEIAKSDVVGNLTPSTVSDEIIDGKSDAEVNGGGNVSVPTVANESSFGRGPVVVAPAPAVVTISEMNDLLVRGRASSTSFAKNSSWSSHVDQELLDARFEIENALTINDHPILHAPLYRNFSTFVRSYEIMEKNLKVFVYQDGKGPVFHRPKLTGIYASEGWFMKHMETSNQFLTTNPEKAHLFYLPYSSQLLVDHVYVPNSHTFHDIITYLNNYIDMIRGRYSFWNKTDGSDHFLVACHDWAPKETEQYMSNCIRALCNADVKEGFKFGKDVSLPETYVHSSQKPMRSIGGKPPLARTTLAFFAGQMHGDLRPILLRHWENKDPTMKIFGKIKKKSYTQYLKSSKYCICAKGYEVNSPRVVEAILYGCVPVIISDNFVPPFFDILNWDSFAIFVMEKDVPNLKKILESIPEKRYVLMQKRVEKVRLHFVWHKKPEKYDIFHMILHSIWYNRVMRLSPRL